MLCELTLAATPQMLSAVMNTVMLTAERPPLIANAAAEEVRKPGVPSMCGHP